jgi:DNA sulfur modification protein DndE
MIVKQFKLSQPEKDKLIRIKSRTGIQNWNVICRWALCWSLAEKTIPGGLDPISDSNVEMTWLTFTGEHHEIYEAIIRQRCINDGLGDDPETLTKYFRLHLYRGINHFSTRDVLRSCQDLLSCITTPE